MPADDEAIQLVSIWLSPSSSNKTLRSEYFAEKGSAPFLQIKLEPSSHMGFLQEPLVKTPVPLSFPEILCYTMVCTPIKPFLAVLPWKGQNKLHKALRTRVQTAFAETILTADQI